MDSIVRAISADGLVSVTAISSREICERARNIHKTLPVATAALGRVLSAASMMGTALKVEGGSVTLQFKGGGPLGTLLAVADDGGFVRGYVQNPGVALMEKYQGKLDVGAAVGKNGTLTVIKDLKMREPYIGGVELVSGEIAEDITSYFAVSEQIPTACALGVLVARDQSVEAAGGYIVQLLPGAGDDCAEKLERSIAEAGPVTSLLAGGLDAEGLARRIMEGFDAEILDRREVGYRCYCTRERVSGVLLSLGREELAGLMDSGESAKVECQFCDTVYEFSPEDIGGLLRSAGSD